MGNLGEYQNEVRMSDIAARLHVDRRVVGNRAARSERNGFPSFKTHRVIGGRIVRVWDWNEVQYWFKNYVPSVGGRPSKKAVDMVAQHR